MEHQIYFSDFDIKESGFCCTVRSTLRELQEDRLFFTLDPSRLEPDYDAIACTLSTLAGNRYHDVFLDIPVSSQCRTALEQFTSAQWHYVKPKKVISQPVWKKMFSFFRKEKLLEAPAPTPRILLNFSGGFDSLAAYAVMPKEHTDLVAVDFGGWFQRETDFFQDFAPYTLHTNFRQLKYDRESWTFMGAASLLFARQRNAKYIAFGTILEASLVNVRESCATSWSTQTLPFSLLGLESVEFVRGLTEVGTAMIVTHYFPELVSKSLASLAAANSEKRYRKQVLTEIVCRRFARPLALPECKIPDSKVILPFGKNFALDFLAIYELKHAGPEVVARTVSNIPEEAVRLSEELSLAFYEKLNPWFLPTIPEQFRQDYLQKLKAAGIEPYNDQDWAEFRQVRDYLSSVGHK